MRKRGLAKRIVSTTLAAVLCVGMMGNVPMVSMAQESTLIETEQEPSMEAEIDPDVSTEDDIPAEIITDLEVGSTEDLDADLCVEAGTEEEAVEETAEEIIGEEQESQTIVSGDWEYIANSDGTITINKWNGRDSVVKVPAKLDGKEVKELGDSAFNYCIGVSSVTIPEGVVKIGSSVFWNCRGLISVKLPSTLIEIDSFAFNGCSGLTSIELPDDLEKIGNYAFNKCANLQYIKLPDSITDIGRSAFLDCGELTEINIPDKVKTIDVETFRNCGKLKSVTLSSNLTSIGKLAFCDCVNLQSVIIPASVQTIGEHAFSNCAALTSVTIPSGVELIDDLTFENCTGLKSVKISKGVKKIGLSAFRGCNNLISVELPSSITSIGRYAFKGCSNMESVVIPSDISFIGWEAFASCSSLTSITFPVNAKNLEKSIFMDCTGLTNVTFPQGVKNIPDSVFYGCSSLTSVVIPASVTKISDNAFRNCTGLTSVVILPVTIDIARFVFDTDIVTIHGYSGSEVEAYAESAGIPFIARETNLSQLKVYAKSVSYNGKEQDAQLYIQDGDMRIPLEEGIDYIGAVTLTDVGTTTATVMGTGKYSGKAMVSFTIKPVNIKTALENETLRLTASDLEYTGRLQYSPVKVTYKGKALKEGTDYILKGNSRKAVGTSWAVVTGTGNYTGTIKVKYAMKKATQPIMLYSPTKQRTVNVRNANANLQLKTSRIRENAEIVYSVEKPNQGITVSQDGKVTVKKGTKPGKYRIKVLAQSTQYYKATSKYFTVVVK